MVENARGDGVVVLALLPGVELAPVDPDDAADTAPQVADEPLVLPVTHGVVVQEAVLRGVPVGDARVQGETRRRAVRVSS